MLAFRRNIFANYRNTRKSVWLPHQVAYKSTSGHQQFLEEGEYLEDAHEIFFNEPARTSNRGRNVGEVMEVEICDQTRLESES